MPLRRLATLVPVDEVRERQRLSQHELAERAGLNPTYLGVETGERNDTGKRTPTWADIRDIAAALEMPPSKLIKLAERRA